MSWSLSAIGTPEKINDFLDAYDANLSNEASKQEFLAAKPGLKTIVGLNSNINAPMVLKLDAAGTAYTKDGVVQSSQLTVELKPLYAVLV